MLVSSDIEFFQKGALCFKHKMLLESSIGSFLQPHDGLPTLVNLDDGQTQWLANQPVIKITQVVSGKLSMI